MTEDNTNPKNPTKFQEHLIIIRHNNVTSFGFSASVRKFSTYTISLKIEIKYIKNHFVG